ncbi:bacteriophage tail protein [Acetobacter nitrogenifigens DSM 23921 = NBRC 105050]|uniref:Tail protein n=1 Tax=Acetobacter nitrogenifigens DSM 23921 = NBRC 105050 TaxID=1120919 RepID=A0A511X5A8_9PROT|nr:YmfQ family protein [Acetobacter nitrogenifigens]GBQ92059.1 bacteriophage tail protein [Acetobacter nitrogenifigens DSM 23921 = NBRC 105050]GEN58139.1 hypothetical protein ANI02nite_00230 [Acetobacter nitrogenifigens DSM 23921 = NBRC 105050]
MSAPVFTVDQFRKALLALLPRGRIWSRDSDGLQSLLVACWAASFQRSAARASNLLTDAFPTTTEELLTEWEDSLGLPDPCAGTNPTVTTRRAQVVARLTDTGGSSIAYYVAFAATLGYTISITEFAPSRFGRKFGTPFGGDAWAYAWQVNVPQITRTYLKFGDQFGAAFSSWDSTVLFCELKRIKPANTVLIFNYTS